MNKSERYVRVLFGLVGLSVVLTALFASKDTASVMALIATVGWAISKMIAEALETLATPSLQKKDDE